MKKFIEAQPASSFKATASEDVVATLCPVIIALVLGSL
jgi:hypothetical protein